MNDILFKTDDRIFSYRVAGVLIRDGHILLQKPTNDSDYALPGGHVAFGEDAATTLAREFREEMNADIDVGSLKWIEENFFRWGERHCHQIGLYYDVRLKDESQIPLAGSFYAIEEIEARNFKIEFHWLPLDALDRLIVYPQNIGELLENYDNGIQHFVSRED